MSARALAISLAIGLLPLVAASSLTAQPAGSPVPVTLTSAIAPEVNAGMDGLGTSSVTVPGASHGPIAAASRYGEFRLVVSCDEFRRAQTSDTGTAALTRTVRIRAGGVVTLTLCSNPSTGFRWESPRYDRSALALVRHSHRPPEVSLAGAPGSETWVFRTLPCSIARSLVCRSSNVVLAYSQPWAGGAKAAWTFTLTVRTIQAPVIEQEPPQPPEPGMR